jgi:hypothetical protein
LKLRILMQVGYIYLKFFQALDNPGLFAVKLKDRINTRIKKI